MKTRTLVVLVLVVAFLAAGVLAMKTDAATSISDWFIALHGGGKH
jgi:hypothetical protein